MKLTKIKISHRKNKRFFSSMLGGIMPGLLIGIFLALVLNQNGLPQWETSITKWVIWSLILIITLFFFRKKMLKMQPDKLERINLHENFLLSIFTTIAIALLIIYNDIIKNNWTSRFLTLGLFIGYYFICNLIFIYANRPN